MEFHLLSPNHFICSSLDPNVCPLSWKSTCVVCVHVCPCVHVPTEHVLFITACFSQHGFSWYFLSLPAEFQLSNHSCSQLGSQTSRLQAAPVGKKCPLYVHKHCHSIKLPSSSKGCRVIRHTGGINSSALENSHTQLPHLPVHINHSLPLWCGIVQACLALSNKNCRWMLWC